MKLDSQILEILNNFQTINSNIALGEDGFVRTMAVSKTLMAKANISDQFPYEFGIYDLGEFLSCLSMFDDPTLTFDDNQKFVNITDGVTTFKYYFSDENKKKTYRSLESFDKKINNYVSNLPNLKNDTNNIIKYVENNVDQNEKFR